MLTDHQHATSWLPARLTSAAGCNVLRRYFIAMAIGNLVWETMQLPFYTIWRTARPAYLAFAVLHCWIGDLLTGSITMLLGIIAAGPHWPFANIHRAVLVTLASGIAYSVFSEWLNVVVRGAWAYSPAMPVLPVLGTGLSPLLQWLIIPGLALLFAYRPHLPTAEASR